MTTHNHCNTEEHIHCMSSALKAAEDVCSAKGERFTPLRQYIFSQLWTSHKAKKAYDILEGLKNTEFSAKPPTVYRALDFLVKHSLAHKISTLNAYIGCYHPERNHICQLLICESCHEVLEICTPGFGKAIKQHTEDANFALKSPVIELLGVCEACSS